MPQAAKRTFTGKAWRVSVCLFFGLLSLGCAASRPPDTAQPNAVAGYPATIVAGEERRTNALGAWRAFAEAQGIAANIPAPEFQPVTATVRTLAPVTVSSTFPRLPRVGAEEGAQTEEQTRQSLRLFIESARALLGVNPPDVSLVAVETLANRTTRARYRQNPFLYNLRGGYGDIEIVFATDGRVLEISSTAIPEAERLRRALAGVRPLVNAEQARASIVGRTLTQGDGANAQTFTVADPSAVTVRELVIYPVVQTGDAAMLEFRLAWEITVSRASAPDTLVYLDAVQNEVIGTINAEG